MSETVIRPPRWIALYESLIFSAKKNRMLQKVQGHRVFRGPLLPFRNLHRMRFHVYQLTFGFRRPPWIRADFSGGQGRSSS